jgi:hypothetical protein
MTDVPRWARHCAHAVCLVVLPSGIWRILAVALGLPMIEHPAHPPEHHGLILFQGWWYVVALTVVSEALAYLTVGLVSPWGERLPRFLGGRPVPIAAAVIPAAAGAIFLTILWPYAFLMISLGRTVGGQPLGVHLGGWQTVVFDLAYWPLAAWGPLLGLVTIQYYRRRHDLGVHRESE